METTIETPVGWLHVVERDDGVLTRLEFVDGPLGARHEGLETVKILNRFFDGDIAAIDQVEVEMDGTEFQRSVWSELRRIPAGVTASYQDIAAAIGNPAAVRAVGNANGRNPICLVVPCHRVVRAGGAIGGYGGGIAKKVWLLDHEARHLGSRLL